ncbi:hypothetical protein [Gordonia humi]|uniref:Uncharacterized protein n=1 Tax=Gordonia humi TaxID=686429 RepID=A0A840F1W9_9ACTN|nr:hypothetical protein [Gordonia humi]MBB4135379.1 hypothetical protein [Gordonia humi]
MPICLTTADSPADPAMHGVLAAVVSLILGVAAHGFGGGLTAHGPATSHVLILGALAVVVGLIRAGQVKSADARRSPGVGWVGTAAALVGGQVVAHACLAMLGHGALMPDTSMLVWHVLALPAAVAVLVVAERLTHACRRRILIVRRLATGVEPVEPIVPAAVHSTLARVHTLLLVSASGVRGPPAAV